ncbi:MAG: hypothetical protein ACJAU0_001829 [Flavobacteriales bacterium]|jgi:hypothetical protein
MRCLLFKKLPTEHAKKYSPKALAKAKMGKEKVGKIVFDFTGEIENINMQIVLP